MLTGPGLAFVVYPEALAIRLLFLMLWCWQVRDWRSSSTLKLSPLASCFSCCDVDRSGTGVRRLPWSSRHSPPVSHVVMLTGPGLAFVVYPEALAISLLFLMLWCWQVRDWRSSSILKLSPLASCFSCCGVDRSGTGVRRLSWSSCHSPPVSHVVMLTGPGLAFVVYPEALAIRLLFLMLWCWQVRDWRSSSTLKLSPLASCFSQGTGVRRLPWSSRHSPPVSHVVMLTGPGLAFVVSPCCDVDRSGTGVRRLPWSSRHSPPVSHVVMLTGPGLAFVVSPEALAISLLFLMLWCWQVRDWRSSSTLKLSPFASCFSCCDVDRSGTGVRRLPWSSRH